MCLNVYVRQNLRTKFSLALCVFLKKIYIKQRKYYEFIHTMYEPSHKHTIHTIEVVQRILDYNIRLKGSDKFFRFLNEIFSAVVLLKESKKNMYK